MNSLLPSMFAGIGGGVRPSFAADARVVSALNVNVAVVFGITPQCAIAAVTPAGSVPATRTARPLSFAAVGASGTGYGFGCADHVSVPNDRRSLIAVWMSVGVIATAVTCFGSKIVRIVSA